MENNVCQKQVPQPSKKLAQLHHVKNLQFNVIGWFELLCPDKGSHSNLTTPDRRAIVQHTLLNRNRASPQRFPTHETFEPPTQLITVNRNF